MPVTVPDDLLDAVHLTEVEMKLEIAITMFLQHRLTLAQASRFAGLDRSDMVPILAQRKIPIYTEEDWRQDQSALQWLAERS
jgi:predicted HTH domain antitoxin